MKHATILLTAGIMVFSSLPVSRAEAAAILNLSDKKQTIEVETAQGFTPVGIEKGQAWRVTGKVKVRFNGRESYIEDNEEYAIWNGDVFGPQKRRPHGGARL